VVSRSELDETPVDTDRIATDETVDGHHPSDPDRATRLEPSELVGRYVVLARVGVGGMGVVYAAYDPELDRKVALKLLAHPGSSTRHAERRERLLREAQALAKFSHPEIVAIHDVGEHEAGVWLAMEFIHGMTLGEWANERPRSWQEVLEVMIAAGRGVAAAHDAGLIHRDLKPDNIMVGHDGRVRVMDFGLTRSQSESEPIRTVKSQPLPEIDLLAKSLTHGHLLGTPAYMAPEQLCNAEITAATDQFAYCVTLWELLYGERPFQGQRPVELARAMLDNRIRHPPNRGVPSWLRRVCERGLSLDPNKRWPSMQDLLDALGRGQARARGRKVAVGLGLAAALIGAVAIWQQIERRNAIAACETEGATISTVWKAETRHALEQALRTPSKTASYTADIPAHLMPWLDAQAQSWRAARTEVCLHADPRTRAEPWDESTLDRALWCLDDRRMEFEALVAELANDNALVAARAVQAAVGLSPIDVCLDHAWLARMPDPPAGDQTQEVEAVRAKLSRVSALRLTGNYAEGLELARESLTQAEAIAWPPLTALAQLRVGSLLQQSAQFEEAATMLERAFFEASRVGAHEVAVDAATSLVFVIGVRLARHVEGRTWFHHAEVALSDFPDPQGLRKATLLVNLANIARASGSYPEAQQLLEQALDLKQRALGPDHPEIANTLSNLAVVLEAQGVYADALPLHERALAIIEHGLGDQHPEVAGILNNLADNYRLQGKHEDAKLLLERALEIKEAALGPEHPSVATSLSNLALVLEGMNKLDEARPLHERALRIKEQALGPKHPEVASVLNNLAESYRLASDYEPALALHERSLAIKEEVLGPDHVSIGMSLTNLALIHHKLGELDEARALNERALAIFEKKLGPEHPHISWPLFALAQIALAQGRPADALTLAERSLAIRERVGSSAKDVEAARKLLEEIIQAGAG
jgi:tetratricopeptide (TPR) repeat protein/predicted Ser/Thr protein kinase